MSYAAHSTTSVTLRAWSVHATRSNVTPLVTVVPGNAHIIITAQLSRQIRSTCNRSEPLSAAQLSDVEASGSWRREHSRSFLVREQKPRQRLGSRGISPGALAFLEGGTTDKML